MVRIRASNMDGLECSRCSIAWMSTDILSSERWALSAAHFVRANKASNTLTWSLVNFSDRAGLKPILETFRDICSSVVRNQMREQVRVLMPLDDETNTMKSDMSLNAMENSSRSWMWPPDLF